MRKINLFGKQISVLVLSLLLLAGLGSATLLAFFATQLQTVEVEQAITSDMPANFDCTTIAGGEICISPDSNDGYEIESHTSVPVTVLLESTYNSDNPDNLDGDGITTTYTNVLRLENKDDSWQPIIEDDNTYADLMFNIVGNEFIYDLNAERLEPDVGYSLIYYADFADRETNWGGNNPGALLGTFTADENGNIQASGSVELGMNLPAPQDWNTGSYADSNGDYADYCAAPDNYDHCRGAKIWLVPSSDYDAGNNKLVTWNPSRYLFETDLVRYFDNSNNELVIPALELVEFYITNEFAVNIPQGIYTITTEIVPQ